MATEYGLDGVYRRVVQARVRLLGLIGDEWMDPPHDEDETAGMIALNEMLKNGEIEHSATWQIRRASDGD